MNAPVSPHHLTPELHDALGRVTLDENGSRSEPFQRRLTCAERKLCRSYKYRAGEASGFIVERAV